MKQNRDEDKNLQSLVAMVNECQNEDAETSQFLQVVVMLLMVVAFVAICFITLSRGAS